MTSMHPSRNTCTYRDASSLREPSNSPSTLNIGDPPPCNRLTNKLGSLHSRVRSTTARLVNALSGNICVKAYARGSGGSTCCGECAPVLLSGLADQDVVWNRSSAGADAEE